MKMIAIGTVHGHTLIREANPRDPKSKAKYKDRIVSPGGEFDTEEFGMDDADVQALIDTKAARRKMREVADDGAPAADIEQPAT